MTPYRSIAYKMTRIVVFLTLFLGLVIGSMQVIWDYQQRLSSLDTRVQEVLKSIEKAAVKAVYTFDTDLAAEIAAGLFEFLPITYVDIKDESNKVMTSMIRYPAPLPFEWITKTLFEKKYAYEVPLFLKQKIEEQIGTLTIRVSPHETATAFWQRSITILSAAVLQSFIVSILLLSIFHKRVTRPLHILASDFNNIDLEDPEKKTLSLDPALKQTEFAEVTTAGNNLLRIIGSQLRAKDKAEIELKRQTSETERFLKIAEAIILQLDRNAVVTMINQRGLDVIGYQLDEVLGKDWFNLVIPEADRETVRNVFNDLFHASATSSNINEFSYYENAIFTKNGNGRRIFWHNSIEKDDFENPIGILSSGQDVTARRKAEDALRASEGSLRAIIEATSEGFAITDSKTMELTDINSSLHEMLGYSREEMLFHPIVNFINPDDITILTASEKQYSDNPHRSFEIRMQHQDGTNVPVEINTSNLPNDTNSNPKFVAFITDITSRKLQEKSQKQLEVQLRQAQKMETIGTLAGGIAHDFNNLLTPILGYSSMLSARIPEDDPNHARILQIAKSANRAADMVKQILTFSRRSEAEMVSTFIAPVIKEALQLIRSTTPSNIEIRQSIDETCPPAIADTTQIQQMVLNLCTNASHAMAKQGGILDIHFTLTEITEKLAQVSPSLKIGPYLLISVSDTGHGMDEETISRIFDPFYTTKKSGEGTGLGLAMVHGIVQNHNGDILVESHQEHGSTFKVYLPISETPAFEKMAPTILSGGNHELALIIDDEVLNTDFLSELMDETHYKYESYNDSIEALSAFRAAPEKYQIILTDQTMPKLTGDQLVKAVREIRPDIPIIMMSGYDKTISTENAHNFGVDIYIQKPIAIIDLTNAMSKLLSGKKKA